MQALPKKFAWMDAVKAPAVWREARRHYGIMEIPGKGNSLEIMRWAKETNQSLFYSSDEVPWCGLFVAIVVKRSDYAIPKIAVRAMEWLNWGNRIEKDDVAWMDVVVFQRPGGGHVGFYVAENKDNILVYGGNQSNRTGFAWISKSRLVGVRRCPWRIGQPAEVVKHILTFDGQLSTNEQ